MNVIASYIIASLLIFSVHPLHVTVTEIEMDEKDKQLKITMRMFVDDLEQTMRAKLKQPELDILNLKNGLTIDQMMGGYLKDHFKISLDGKGQEIKFLGSEIEDDAFIFYLEVTHVKKWKGIQILNSSLTETYEDQSNLVNVTAHGTVRSLRLTTANPLGKLIFEAK